MQTKTQKEKEVEGVEKEKANDKNKINVNK